MKKSILTGMIAATLGLFNTANAEGMDPAALKTFMTSRAIPPG